MTARILPDTDPDDYHSLPGFSASIAKVVIAKSPLHAWSQHPCYGGIGKESTKTMDRGTIGHALVLGKGKRFAELAFKDWRTDAAKDARDAARAAGLIPVLSHELAEYRAMAAKVSEQLAARGILLDGASELAIEWTEDSLMGPVLCRCQMDHVKIDEGIIYELKFTDDASPFAVERTAENMGYGIARAAYARALTALRPELAGRIKFQFLFCEPDPPYALNVSEGDGVFKELGERRWLRAVEQWGCCLATGVFPGYGEDIKRITAPAWALQKEAYEL